MVSKFCQTVSLLQSVGISLAMPSPGWYRRLQYQPIRYQSFVGQYLYYNQLVSHWLWPHLVGIASSDGTEALVSCELVGNSTLSSCREQQWFHSLTCLMVIEFRWILFFIASHRRSWQRSCWCRPQPAWETFIRWWGTLIWMRDVNKIMRLVTVRFVVDVLFAIFAAFLIVATITNLAYGLVQVVIGVPAVPGATWTVGFNNFVLGFFRNLDDDLVI